MNLDRRQRGDLERVADRVRVVRPGARVEHERRGGLARPVDELAVLALVIGLGEGGVEPEVAGEPLDTLLELGSVRFP